MKILEIRPVFFEREDYNSRVVDVKVEVRCGLLWLNKRIEIRRAHTTTNILYSWLHSNTYTHTLTAMIKGSMDQLLNGDTVYVQPKQLEE
jgi:hypothetical protein